MLISIRKVCFYILVFISFLSSHLFAQEIEGTWFKKNIKPNYKNSFFSYTIYSFKKNNNNYDVRYIEIYPEESVRTNMKYAKSSGLNIDDIKFKTYKEIELDLKSSGGMYSPFKNGGEVKKISLEEFALKIDSVKEGDSLNINGVKYKNYVKAFLDAQEKEDAKSIVELYQFVILETQSKIEGFGGIKTLNLEASFDGFYSGSQDIVFEGRGKGSGAFSSNAGLSFTFKKYQPFNDVYIDGISFGGKSQMDGTVTISIKNKPLFTIYYGDIQVKKGVADSGQYVLTFLKNKKIKKINYSVLPD